jgi:hypothetical protein
VSPAILPFLIDIRTMMLIRPSWPSFRPEHILTVRTLQSIPTSSLEWSVFCPARMKISNPVVISNPSTSLGDHLVLGSDTPPMYQPTGWLQYIPFIGMMLEIIVMAIRYTTVMEDVADKIAGEFGEERWVGKLVGAREMKRKMESSQEIRRESESS